MNRSLLQASLALTLFLGLEAAVHQATFHDPRNTSWLVWEGPVSLVVLAVALSLAWRGLHSRPKCRGALALGSLAALILAAAPVFPAPQSDYRIEVRKSERRLCLLRGETVVGTYPLVLGSEPDQDKELEGDGRTPLGRFYVCDKGPSQFHKWLGLSYPNLEDAWRGRRHAQISWLEFWYIRVENLNGRIPYASSALGGAVGIHGGGTENNWTLGCIAMENSDLDKLYAQVGVGTRVDILP